MSSPQIKVEKRVDSAFRVRTTFIIIYIFFMSARAIFNPFITVFLQEKGFAAERIGFITGVNSLVIIISQPFWGIISDKLRSSKITLIICMMLQAAFSLALVYSNVFLLVAACFCAHGFFSSPEGPMLDTWCLNSLKRVGVHNAVGQMKFLGCFGFATFSILSGYVINQYNTDKILPVYAMVLFAIAFCLIFVKDSSEEKDEKKKEKPKKLNVRQIFKDKKFIIFLVFILIMQLPHRAGYTFYPLLITELGGDKMMVGYTSAVMFLSEGICMFFSRKMLNRFRPEKVILISAVFFTIWQLLYSVASQPWHIATFALLDGPSYGIFTIAVLYYLDSISPKELRTTYQTVAYAVYFGLSGILGNSLGGIVIDHFGYRTMFLSGVALILISILFFIKSSQILNKGVYKNG